MARKSAVKATECEITLVKMLDDQPDLSHLGEYSERPGKHFIDRKERGDAGPREYRYFNAGAGDPEYIEEDYKRMEAYNRGDWAMLGIWAEAKVVIGGVTQTIRSGGLWGVESDAGKYLNEVGDEQLQELYGILSDMGIKCRKVKAEDLEWKERYR